jgi:heterodisulfide reductase subunit B
VEELRKKVTTPLEGLKVACYYGCLLTRPPDIAGFDDIEHPSSMDMLLTALGAEPVEWPYKTECCGASLSMTNTGIVHRLSHKIITMARRAGAECIAVACPLCQVNLDLRQKDAAKQCGEIPDTPVFYITQILGLALGLSPKELGLKALVVSPDAIVNRFTADQPAETGGTP